MDEAQDCAKVEIFKKQLYIHVIVSILISELAFENLWNCAAQYCDEVKILNGQLDALFTVLHHYRADF